MLGILEREEEGAEWEEVYKTVIFVCLVLCAGFCAWLVLGGGGEGGEILVFFFPFSTTTGYCVAKR